MKTSLAAALSMALLAQAGGAYAEDLNLSRIAKAGRETPIGCGFRWKNKTCEPVIPKLVIVVPPDHGSICARDCVATAKRNLVGEEQTCIGKRIKGLQVIYRPASNYSGPDRVDYVIQLPKNPINVHVNIEVRPGDAAPTSGLGEESIAPGMAGETIVACVPLMS